MSASADTKTFQDAFALFDRKGDGKIPADKLGDMLRAVGQNPTQVEVSELTKNLKGDSFSFDDFTKVVNRPGGFKSLGDAEDYIRGFQVFDKEGTGEIGVGELKYLLTHMGEPLSESEVNELIEGVNVSRDGNVNYTEFVKSILAQ